MKLSIFHDGQFFVGLVEYQDNLVSKFLKVTFGSEPSDEKVLNFIYWKLNPLLEKTITTKNKPIKPKKVNPKRLQRKVAKEQKAPKFTTLAQQAIKEEQELKKHNSKKLNKLKREQHSKYQRKLKRKRQKISINVTK